MIVRRRQDAPGQASIVILVACCVYLHHQIHHRFCSAADNALRVRGCRMSYISYLLTSYPQYLRRYHDTAMLGSDGNGISLTYRDLVVLCQSVMSNLDLMRST